jgi:hypothetical protein
MLFVTFAIKRGFELGFGLLVCLLPLQVILDITLELI